MDSTVPLSRSSTARDATAVRGVRANALRTDQTSRTIGAAFGKVPTGNEVTTVSPWPGSRPLAEKVAAPIGDTAEVHGASLPNAPSKQAARRISAGPSTRAETWRIGTPHWVPMTFQYSSW